jgi:hypothetical protein
MSRRPPSSRAVVVVHDRKVSLEYLRSNEASIYQLARAWVLEKPKMSPAAVCWKQAYVTEVRCKGSGSATMVPYETSRYSAFWRHMTA